MNSETKKVRKLDIFQVLGEVSKKNTNFYSTLSDEEQKAYQPFVIMRWLSGTNNLVQIVYINELVNPYVFSIQKHKELLHKLMTVCAPGQSKRYYWLKANSSRSSSSHVIDIIKEYFKYDTKQAIEARRLLSPEDILSYAIELGKQPDEIKKIEKELK